MQIETCSVDESIVHRFLRQNPGDARHGGAAALDRFLQMLRSQRTTPAQKQSQTPPSDKQRLISKYERYLLEERGLTKATVSNYVPVVDQFLSIKFQQRPSNFSRLRAADITGFVQDRARKLAPRSAY